MPTIEKVFDGSHLGEGPHWDVASQSLYTVDIFGKSIIKYVPATKKVTKAQLEKTVSFIIPVEGKTDQFVISHGNELVLISWDGESDEAKILTTLASVDTTEEQPITFNDAKSDSSGRLWAGTHSLDVDDFAESPPVGTLYSLDPDLEFKAHVDKIQVSNGIAINDKTKKFFYNDTVKGTVDRFDFHIDEGTITNREVWFTLGNFNIPPYPDGMTIDTDGNLWVAVFSGYSVIKIDGNKPETLLETIEFPAEQVTSVTFGGPNLDELYVTSAAIEFKGETPVPPVNGTTFRVTGVGAKGFPAANFKLDE